MNERYESCNDIRASLPLWAGGDLEAEENFRVQEHLDSCKSCFTAADLADQARRALVLRLEGEVESAPDLWSGVRAGLVQEEVLGAPVLHGPGHWLRKVGVGSAAAAAALLLTLAWSGRLEGEPEGLQRRVGVGGLAAQPSLPSTSQPMVSSDLSLMGTNEQAPQVSKSRRLRRAGPGAVERWSDAEFLQLEHLQELGGMRAKNRKSDIVLTSDR